MESHIGVSLNNLILKIEIEIALKVSQTPTTRRTWKRSTTVKFDLQTHLPKEETKMLKMMKMKTKKRMILIQKAVTKLTGNRSKKRI